MLYQCKIRDFLFLSSAELDEGKEKEKIAIYCMTYYNCMKLMGQITVLKFGPAQIDFVKYNEKMYEALLYLKENLLEQRNLCIERIGIAEKDNVQKIKFANEFLKLESYWKPQGETRVNLYSI